MVRRKASKSRSRSGAKRGGGVKKRGGKAGAFLNFVRSMRDLFPNHTPTRLKKDSQALWREMNSEDKGMYSSQQMCGPGRMGRSRSRSRSRSRRSRSRSRSRSRRSRRRRPGR
ncbi:U2 small nuclear ribonucleoprotein auxiliary factor 35 kDa subunit-related protein 2-like [Frankliniella occidentalis]|uniref:U2 small nuclear ribonucleoprotein auxiliary factor 35 kDa subunit-related protein 2-like n=1 Tax=Frankliniella occidentalis TaxID=133901 RepID=A0A6J1S789_FRAOC|nr:U2 small nuclear ribonucleoprotein auxiliary factor 35 kDa subunit-related protein 2-like [Frankliniella occidentalis]